MARRQVHGIPEVIQRRRWRESDARMVIQASQESGKSLSGFAREYGVQPARDWRWAARFKEQANRPVLFHPVRIVEPPNGRQCAGGIKVILLDR
jgi:transposase-like protein